MRADEFVVEGYREAEQEFANSADIDQVKKMIDAYRSLVDRNQVQGQERNIDYWRKQGWDKFVPFVQAQSQVRSKTQIKQARGIKTQQITLRDDATWLIVVPVDKDTSCFHGRGTDWCTSKVSQQHFEQYFYKNGVTLIYCINKQSGGKWAIAAHKRVRNQAEYFDQRDQSLTKDQFNQATGLDSSQIIQQALNQTNAGVVAGARSTYQDAVKRLTQLKYTKNIPRSLDEIQKIEQLLLFVKDPNMIIKYIQRVKKQRWPAVEPMFARDLELAYWYARDVIKGRWPELEPKIAQDPRWAYQYARDVIKGRWPEVEPMLAQDPKWAYLYAKNIIGGRWPEVEPVIAQDPDWALAYAEDVIGGRWPEGEPAIAQNSNSAYQYAHRVIGGRWPEGEPAIAQDPDWALDYAEDIIGGRWPAAEPAIAQDPYSALVYARDVIKKRWPKAEPVIAQNPDWAYQYACDVIKGPWPEAGIS